uniref:Uncharacterized protein n=1 Tax=Arundo donax TaxID=35708 RepID=A0A0A8YS12_ARUDO
MAPQIPSSIQKVSPHCGG